MPSSNPQQQSTDHLCTNFKRLIKLTDSTPAFNNNISPAHIIPAHHQFAPTETASPSSTLSALNIANNIGDSNDCDSDSDLSKSRFGQIQMETRSTRKFLIKHHPYLQLNNQQQQLHYNYTAADNNSATTLGSRDGSEQRPSINFIKMKKLKKKAAAAAAAAAHRKDNTSSSRAATRSSRVNSNRYVINLTNTVYNEFFFLNLY